MHIVQHSDIEDLQYEPYMIVDKVRHLRTLYLALENADWHILIILINWMINQQNNQQINQQ